MKKMFTALFLVMLIGNAFGITKSFHVQYSGNSLNNSASQSDIALMLPVDTEAPSIPTGLVATNITETSFDLSWDASNDDVGIAFYELYINGAWAGGVTETSKVFNALNSSTAYSVSLRAYDAAGNPSDESAKLVVTTLGPPDTEAPSIPTGLIATNITETSFDLSWDTSTDNVGIFGYEVFRNGAWIGANTIPSLHVTGLSAGTSYNFTVNAFDVSSPANSSAASSALVVTTSGVVAPDTEKPTVPTGLVATNITETSFDLNWDASTDNVGVFGYEVFQNGGWIGANTIPSLHITGLTAGTTYNFTVDAFDTSSPANISSPSIEFSVTTVGAPAPPDTEKPSVPISLVANNISETSFDLNWDASTDNVAVFGYEVFQNGGWIGANTIPSLHITGLTAGTTYNFTVDAFDTSSPANISSPSIALSVTTVGAPAPPDTEKPSVPTGLVASNITETSFDLTWNTSTDNVGVHGYEVYLNGAWAGATIGTTLNVHGLLAGTTYNVSVGAFDDALNLSAPSLAKSVKTAGTALADLPKPSVPAGLVASNMTMTSFNLSWKPSASEFGGVAYQIFKDGVYLFGTSDTTINISGLKESVKYSFTVDAYAFSPSNQPTESAQSDALIVTLGATDVKAPTIPIGLASSHLDFNSFNLSWSASTDNVGVHGYEIYINGAWAGATTETHYTLTGLIGGTTYSITVAAFDDLNNLSAPSAAISVTTIGVVALPDTEAPSEPTGLVATNITETSFDLSWTPSTDNVAVFGYEVFQNGAWIGANTSPTLHITGLKAGTTYNFTVDAFDTAIPKAYISAPSAALSVTTSGVIVPPTPDTETPSVPTGLVASNITETSFDLSWDASTDNVAVFGYEVFQNGVWIGANTAPSLHVTGLLAGTSYNFTVNAFDTAIPKANISAPSTVLKVTTTGTPVIVIPDTQTPSIPTGLVATNITETSFDLSWTASTDNVAVFGYEVYSTSFVWIGATTTTSLHITGLTKGTTYKYTVDAFDTATPANISKASAVITVTTSGASGVSEVPTVPTGLVASKITKTSCTLSWTSSTDNVGVHGYEVYKDGVYLGGTTGLSMDINRLECGLAYAFTVDAFDSETPANISKPSSALLVSTVDCILSAPGISSPEVSIFPNPAVSILTVKNLPENAIVSVLTLDGSTMSKVNAGANSSMEFDVTSWNSGVYLIQVQAGRSSVVKKVIVEK